MIVLGPARQARRRREDSKNNSLQTWHPSFCLMESAKAVRGPFPIRFVIEHCNRMRIALSRCNVQSECPKVQTIGDVPGRFSKPLRDLLKPSGNNHFLERKFPGGHDIRFGSTPSFQMLDQIGAGTRVGCDPLRCVP